MAEEKKAPNWKLPAIWSVSLLAAVMLEIPILSHLRDKTGNIVGALWDIANLAISLIVYTSWSTQIKRAPFFSPPKGEIYRPSIPFFITAILQGIGCGASILLFGESPKQRLNVLIVYLFLYLTLLLLVRGALIALVRIVSGQREKLPQRLATGFADGVLILAHGALLFPRVGEVRFIIFALVLTAIRIGWGFVPEERLEIVREFFLFLKERKLWWMTPIFVILALLAVVVVLSESTGGAFPFIYAVF